MGCCPFWKRKKVMAEENQQQYQVTLAPIAEDPSIHFKNNTLSPKSNGGELRLPNDISK